MPWTRSKSSAQPVPSLAFTKSTHVYRSPLKLPRKKKALTILLVGETGSGKTSFLSLLLNLLKGNGPFDLTEQHDTNTESGLDTTQSQTIGARLYPFTTAGGIEFQIIDTPGLADTRGMDENSKHKERIFSAVKELITRIDAVMLVINGRNERLSASTSYTLETLATLFPRSIENNIGIIFTNTDLYGGLNFNMNALPLGLRAAKSWRLENPLSKYKDYLGRMRELTEAQRKESPQARRLLEDYEGVVKTLDNWFAWLDSQEAVPTKAIIDLYHKSNEIESRLFDTTLSLENLPRLRKALRDLVEDLEGVERVRVYTPTVYMCAHPFGFLNRVGHY
jgi:GTPase SAR1 family protein